jgi:hypothetical protein
MRKGRRRVGGYDLASSLNNSASGLSQMNNNNSFMQQPLSTPSQSMINYPIQPQSNLLQQQQQPMREPYTKLPGAPSQYPTASSTSYTPSMPSMTQKPSNGSFFGDIGSQFSSMASKLSNWMKGNPNQNQTSRGGYRKRRSFRKRTRKHR